MHLRSLRLSLLAALLCVSALSASALQFKTEANIPYLPGAGSNQQLDLYIPDTAGFPTLLFIHGGSLVSGDRADTPHAEIARQFVGRNIAFASMNYRLGTANKWPAMIEDVAAAFAWLKDSIASRGGDPKRIFVLGHSSGALLAAILSTDTTYLAKHHLSPSDIAGCVPMGTMLNPSYDIDSIPDTRLVKVWERLSEQNGYESIFPTPADYRDADPMHHIDSRSPRFLVLVADSERFEPPILEQANRFAKAMQQVGVQVQVEIIKNRRHITALTRMREPDDPAFLKIVEFVERR